MLRAPHLINPVLPVTSPVTAHSNLSIFTHLVLTDNNGDAEQCYMHMYDY